MNQKLMLSRFLVVAALAFMIVSVFLPWFEIAATVDVDGIKASSSIDFALFDTPNVMVIEIRIIKALMATAVTFTVFALLASFWSVSHPFMMSLFAFVALVFGIAAFSYYIANSGKKQEIPATDPDDPTQEVIFRLDPFDSGFILFVVGAGCLLLGGVVAFPMSY